MAGGSCLAWGSFIIGLLLFRWASLPRGCGRAGRQGVAVGRGEAVVLGKNRKHLFSGRKYERSAFDAAGDRRGGGSGAGGGGAGGMWDPGGNGRPGSAAEPGAGQADA